MEDDQEQRPESLLPYDVWTEEALRHVVMRAIEYAARSGLPGDHHFYITFRTDHPDAILPARLRAQYPQEMTIILQHQFWDLKVEPERFSVGLSFGGVPTTLVVPFAAMTAFADPHVRHGLRFRVAAAEPEPVAPPVPEAEPAAAPQVVSLDAFRRRPAVRDVSRDADPPAKDSDPA